MGLRISGIIFIAALLSIFVYVSYSTGEVDPADEANTTSATGYEEESASADVAEAVLGPVNRQNVSPGTKQTGHMNISGKGLFGNKVGIGKTNPQGKLHVFSNTGLGGTTGIFVESKWGPNPGDGRKWMMGSGGSNRNGEFVITDKTSNKNRLKIAADGNIGIGKFIPAEKLHVAGNVKANKFIGDGSMLTNTPPGPKGDKGDQGVQGKRGATGAQGVQGENRGPGGAQGVQGKRGPIGVQGVQGKRGPKGDKGDTSWTKSGLNIFNNNTGRVGIGTGSPGRKLDITERIRIRNGASTAGIWYADGTTERQFAGVLAHSATGNNQKWGVWNNSAWRFIVQGNGNVGMGTIAPATRLHLNGSDNNGIIATLKITSGVQNMLLDGNEIDALADGLFLNNNTNQQVVLANGWRRCRHP